MKKQAKSKHKATDRVRGFFANLGPGLITGAADDDPSGIATYSIAGAAFGYMPLWMALFSFPLMAAVQLWSACSLLIVANVFNIGADLGGMAEVTEMMTGIQSYYWTPLYTILIISLL